MNFGMLRPVTVFIEEVITTIETIFFFASIFDGKNTTNIFDEFIYYGDEWRPPNKRQPKSALTNKHTCGHIPLTFTHSSTSL